MSERIYRDPVHNIIRLRSDTDDGRLLIRLIDTPEFQRLRRIKQLGLGLYTYQGAEHSRFTHSLGALHLMARILDRLRESNKISPEDRAAAKPAALAQLVSSQLDVDRMDYLLRDSLMTGAKYGLYDLEWIINALQIDEDGDRIYVAARGVFAVEEYLQARYYMFRQVYFHRTLRSA